MNIFSKIGDVDIIDFNPNNPKKVIVYFQGNCGNITTKERTLTILLDSFNTRVIAVDYLKLNADTRYNRKNKRKV
jgi:hypothetical protein